MVKEAGAGEGSRIRRGITRGKVKGEGGGPQGGGMPNCPQVPEDGTEELAT